MSGESAIPIDGGPGELAALIGEFNAVMTRLEASHETLRREVARLNEELREANESLERSRRLAALGEMAAGIAHEIRNPLAAIGLNARMLREDLAQRPAQAQLATRIAEAVRGLDGIVRDVLSFARDLRPRPAPIDSAALLDRVASIAGAGELGEGVSIECRADGSLAFCADEGLLLRALVNIARNGLEAMRENPPADAGPSDRGGSERILRLEASGPAAGSGGGAIIRISDSGPGIDGATLDRMFNPFFTTRAMGTGLGLAIVHRIVDAHGGRIEVRTHGRSALGRGTTFEIHIPAIAGDGRDAEPPITSNDTPTTADGAGMEQAA